MVPSTFRLKALVGRYPTLLVVPIAWLWVLANPVGLAAYLVSLACCGVALVMEVVRRRLNWDGPTAGLPGAIVFFVAVGFLREAGGGVASGVGLLALVPIFESALYGRDRRSLLVLLAAETALYVIPILVIGPPHYPETQYRAGCIVVAVSAVVALTTQRLVGQMRREASDAQRSRTMLEHVTGIVHGLFASPDVRADLCAGTVRISDASLAMLFEPDFEAGVLRTSAVAGGAPDSQEVPLDSTNPIGSVLLSGRPRLVEGVDERALAAPEVWRACGRPQVLLYQPLVRGGETVGVLGVAWPQRGDEGSGRRSAVELLAHEAALVLDRADRVTLLTDLAQTDPLTGLPNRRAWDSHVAAALDDNRQLTVALLDIDHFKAFNDSFGHPAGDRLLRESAAAWREVLRDDDVLARLGGEEFGVLLLDCGPQAALEVTERLRAAMPGGQTCSAGLAARRTGEPIESVVARADEALYEAKAAGRDLARAAS